MDGGTVLGIVWERFEGDVWLSREEGRGGLVSVRSQWTVTAVSTFRLAVSFHSSSP
jgi:hypothetical protein